MKTKKLVSLFLAVAMIFAVLTVSVSADVYRSTNGTSYSNLCSGRGTFRFTDSARQAWATVAVTNTSGSQMTFRVQTQCTLVYSDNSYDYDYTLNNNLSVNNDKTDSSTTLFMTASSAKTMTGFSVEFHIGDVSQNSMWEGYIGEDYYLGINA